MRRAPRAALPLAALLLAGVARADPAHEADALFAEGHRLMESERWADACPKLEASQRLDPKLGNLANLAYCHERLGRTALAWREYRAVLAQAVREGRAREEGFARAQLAAIEPRVTWLVLEGTLPDGCHVTLDGEAAPDGRVATEPGRHLASVACPGHDASSTWIEVGERSVTHRLAPGAAHAPPAPAATRRLHPLVIPAAALAVVGLGVGTGFGVHALAKNDAASAECPADRCTARGLALDEDARSAATMSTIAVGTGLALAATALALWLLAPVTSGGGRAAARGP